jgi:transcriptional activator SPT8
MMVESQGGSSDDDQNEQQDQPEPMDEGDDQGGEDEGEGEGEGEGEDDDEEGEGEGDDDDDVNGDEDEDGTPQAKPSQEPQAASRSGAEGSMPTSLGPTPHLPPPAIDGPAVTVTQPSPKGSPSEETNVVNDYSIRPEALNAKVYDIVPTIAAPQSTSINVVTATPDLRWVFSGGSDGYIRKFNWVDTANSKLMLTVAQRHPFVDSVTKAGVLTSYWENDDPQGETILRY